MQVAMGAPLLCNYSMRCPWLLACHVCVCIFCFLPFSEQGTFVPCSLTGMLRPHVLLRHSFLAETGGNLNASFRLLYNMSALIPADPFLFVKMIMCACLG